MFKVIPGYINKPVGFKAAGMFSGIKKAKKDLAMVYTSYPAEVACVFTTNVVKAAPVLWNKNVYESGEKVSAIVVNSGNANACTGLQGIADNETMATKTAALLDCKPSGVLVASTGVIGVPMPMTVIEKGIDQIVPKLKEDDASGLEAAEAIMTTDTFTKTICVQFEIEGKTVTISGMSKGSGMIHPNMATMLSFVTTDAVISKAVLSQMLKEINEDTYNMISVDGDTSTNDMVLVLANGAVGHTPIATGTPAYDAFKEAFYYVHETLAKQIVKDGEGANKLIEVAVEGANNTIEAKQIVKSVLTSNLVKTALFGEDANWGRVLCAAGYSGAAFDPMKVDLWFSSEQGKIQLLAKGEPIVFSEDKAAEILSADEIKIALALQEGEGSAVGWGCDLSYEYVKINGEYRS
ncbi:bifunctional glutamate N-acetyltransferase/amino-acid acetyltransferase ArgJ [Fusibacter paucivorans]|uniref:Arginine biosynthesis bifunctional protein ArgJ n=1 Tax=Fusibacter paucivorans TaxID=76009 RepID=A0ABS5PK97_9FIRM|nr:bifunctional glutamate N-acetyltransferase/amino-acid acetyltransferase ArgJ [Fusibacter paucivorans]MBS7525594.1 bifunctional glutamate N-acetyltransferase/amino-acid acetyltransferase ArgJ [Fusibacter paucivorans]